MKFKSSLITIAGCAAILGSTFVYAESDWNDSKQSYKNGSVVTKSSMGQKGQYKRIGQRDAFLQTLDLSPAQQTEIKKIREKSIDANKGSIKLLKESSKDLRKLMTNPNAKQADIDKQIDKRFAAMADLAKSKSHARNIIYTQILNKEQKAQIMDMLKKKMAEGRGKGIMHHGPMGNGGLDGPNGSLSSVGTVTPV